MLAHVTLFTCAELHGSGEDGETIGQTCFLSWLSADCHHGQSDHTSPPQYSEMICIFVSLVDEKNLFILLFNFNLYVYGRFACMYICAPLVMPCVYGGHKRPSEPMELQLQILESHHVGLGTESSSSGRRARSLNCTTFMIFMPLFDNWIWAFKIVFWLFALSHDLHKTAPSGIEDWWLFFNCPFQVSQSEELRNGIY